MSAFQVFWRILMPQTIRHALPGFGNNWLVLLKTTALLSVLGLDDLRCARPASPPAPRGSRSPSTGRRLGLPVADQRLHGAAGLGRAPRRAALHGLPMDFSIIAANLGLYFQGLWTTVWLVATALVLGCCCRSRWRWRAPRAAR